jgi:hypothetical protein
MIKDLYLLANRLDRLGLFAMADEIDSVIKTASKRPWLGTQSTSHQNYERLKKEITRKISDAKRILDKFESQDQILRFKAFTEEKMVNFLFENLDSVKTIGRKVMLLKHLRALMNSEFGIELNVFPEDLMDPEDEILFNSF